MKLLPLILACLLLCGCAGRNTPEETTPPTENVVTETRRPEEYGGSVEKMPLNLTSVQGLHVFNGGLLLLSGGDSTLLTLLDSVTLEVRARAELDFPPEEGSLRVCPEGTLSCFDPVRRETVVLDGDLSVLRRIETPGAATGAPVLSGDILYYCTPTHLRSWDLKTNIRRSIREMAFDQQVLTDVLLEGTVLQCTVTEAGRESTRFYAAEDGTLLHSLDGTCSLRTEADRYYARLSAGANRICLFGTAGAEPLLLMPEDPEAQAFFLPEAHLLLTAGAREDIQTELCLYSLSDGTIEDRLPLEPRQQLRSVRHLDGRLYLLTSDPGSGQDVLLAWSPGSIGEDCRITAYRDRELSGLLQKAEALGAAYGIRILIGPEAEQTAPAGLCFEAEPLPTILHRELELLEVRLKNYPKSLLSQTAGHFSSLTICILRSIRDTGPEDLPEAQFLKGTDAYVAIAAGHSGEQGLYHGLFHVMETHIYSRSKALDQWNDLNPAGFQYDYDYAANAVRDSGVYLFEDHRAFVDTYSMSFPREDRARIMEYAMLPGQEALFRTDAMQKKLRTICTGIREAYGLEDAQTAFLWEQYLE